jgi:hypothetical protein
MASSPAKELGEEGSTACTSELQMGLGAEDAGGFGLVLDDVDREELSPGVRETSRAQTLAGFGDGVVAGEHVDDEATGGVTEHLFGGLPAATRGIAVRGDVGRDEAP